MNLGTPMFTKSSHVMEEIEDRIERVFKKVWMLKKGQGEYRLIP